MKSYGYKKATEFSKKQAGIIYRMAKAGEVEIEKHVMSSIYDMADYYGYDDNGDAAREERYILEVIEAATAGSAEATQGAINDYTEYLLSVYTSKKLNQIDRNYVK